MVIFCFSPAYKLIKSEIIIMRYTNKTIMSFVEQLFIHIGNKNDDDFEDNPGETFLKWYDGNIGIKIEKEKSSFFCY